MTTSNTVQTTDLMSLFREKVASNIRGSFVDMIPEEMLQGMVDSAIDEFLNGPKAKRFVTTKEYVGSDYRDVTKPTDYKAEDDPKTLPGMIKKGLIEAASSYMAETHDRLITQFKNAMATHRDLADTVIGKVLKDNTEGFVTAMFTNVALVAMHGAVGHFNDQLIRRSNGYTYGQNGQPITFPPIPGYCFQFTQPYTIG